MAAQITNYQCPACTGPLHFDGAVGKLVCDYCDSMFAVEEIEALYKDKEDAASAAMAQEESTQASAAGEEFEEYQTGETWGADAAGMKAYNCPSCGAELICDATTAATSCPYCGNPTVVPGKFRDMLKPDYVIPFRLDKDAAVRALKKYYKGKKLLPKAFEDQNHIEEIKGVYVPFWLFNGRVEGDVSFRAVRTTAVTRGNERITTNEYFDVRRAGTLEYRRIPADASSKMPDEHMDAIEPFDYDELKPFSTAYLPGFLADVYDVSVDECGKRAQQRAVNTMGAMLQQTVKGYTTCSVSTSNYRIRKGRADYALMPVWLLSTRYNNKNYLFAMNGQTGKLIGDLPVSKGRFMAWFAGISLPLMFVLYFLMGGGF